MREPGQSSWVTPLRHLSQALLEEAEIEETLALATNLIRTWTNAEAALLFLPSFGGDWACEVTAGENTEQFIGLTFPSPLSFHPHEEAESGLIYPDVVDSPLGISADFSKYEAALVALLSTSTEERNGAVVVLRRRGSAPFLPEDLEMVEISALQVQLALNLADTYGVKEKAILLEERERISRDLHDYVIQEIFGAGIGLDRLRAQAEEENLRPSAVSEGLRVAIKSLEDAVLQIRRIVYTINEPPAVQLFTEVLEAETSRARTVLGFAPSLVFELDGISLIPNSPVAREQIDDLCSRVSESIAADSAATVREALSNVARHAQARSAAVTVSVSGRGIVGEMVISILDDGVGVDLSASRGSGIDNMGRRAALHGGSFAMGAGPRGRGTSLVWRVPLD